MTVRILGIDPGLSSGACAIYSVAAKAFVLTDLPTTGQDAQKRINAPALRDWLRKYAIHRAFIESVWALPKEAASFSYRYGRAVGALEAVVATCDIPITYTVPQQWKKFYGLRGSDKELSRTMAIQRFPRMAVHLERKKDDHRAEAMLIAFFGAAVVGAVSSMAPLDNPHSVVDLAADSR